LVEGVGSFKDGLVGSQAGDGQGDGTYVYTEHLTRWGHSWVSRRRALKTVPFCPISASDKNFNPRNTKSIPVVKISAFLDLGQN
jgi:hypothetical protein